MSLAEKKYSDPAECGLNHYVDYMFGDGYGPWRPNENAITQADKQAARDAAEAAAEAAARSAVKDIIARGCPTRGDPPCSKMHWTDEPDPLEGVYRALPQKRQDSVAAARLLDIVVMGVHVRVDGWRWYVRAYCEYDLQFECTSS